MDKVSFIGKLAMLSSATSDDAEPTPGYMLPDISQITFQSGGQNQDLIDFLDDRLTRKSCFIKSKVLRIMKYLVSNGHPDFRQGLRKRSQRISEAIKCSGPPHPLHGNALYLQVRQEAKELSELLFMVSENDYSPSVVQLSNKSQGFGMGSSGSGKLEGFGSTPVVNDKSVGDSLIDGLRSLAQRVADLSSDPRKDVTFSTTHSSLIPGYRPAVVPDVGTSSIDDGVQRLLQPSNVRPQKRHIKGVAGGGWDDDDCLRQSGSSSKCHSKDGEKSGSIGGCSGGSLNSDKFDSLNEMSKSDDDCSSERHLLESIIFVNDDKELIPERGDIHKFVTNCAHVNCEKIVELMCSNLEPSKVAYSMRSLLLLEALLRTDLVSPDFIALTCGKHLATLFTDATVDSRVQQKARKIIRILEKLAHGHSLRFCDVRTENPASESDKSKPAESLLLCTTNNKETISGLAIAGCANKEDNSESSAFPFLFSDTLQVVT